VSLTLALRAEAEAFDGSAFPVTSTFAGTPICAAPAMIAQRQLSASVVDRGFRPILPILPILPFLPRR
jgi:Flp pilus assembly protein CpaB